ncbi:MAG: tetratricopeptide repeat protein, partial [Polyangiaceae bacterium]
ASAISLFRQKNYAAASGAFGAYLAAHPRGANAEDASYLEAVSLAESGRTDAAEKTAERHLAQYPSSFHRKEASILVARIARDRGDCAKARVVLAPWLSSPPDPDAEATLRSCNASP